MATSGGMGNVSVTIYISLILSNVEADTDPTA